MRIAALLTCFNRKEKTLLCLKHLFEIAPGIEIYLVDDGSTDGTSEAIEKLFPMINVINGNGNLFWNRGMHLAWQEAAKHDYDYYLWLNDDVVLYDFSIKELLECSTLTNNTAVISGIIESKDKFETLYGGSNQNKMLLKSNGAMQEITFLNGNVVLVPRSVYNILGTLDPTYHHDMGDVDYGFRAAKMGISVYTTRSPIGYGEKNPICRERVNNTTLLKRFEKLYSPLGSNPNLNFYFRNKYISTMNAIIYYIFQHFLNIIPDKINNAIFKDKYK